MNIGNEKIELEKRKVIKESFKKGFLYVWMPDPQRRCIVHLNDDEDGIVEIDNIGREDHWYFEHNLVGWVYGPFSLAKRKSK